MFQILSGAPTAFSISIAIMLISASASPARGGASTTNPSEPDKINLFEAGKGGYATYRIPGIVVTRSGTLLAYCEGRKSGTLDWDEIEILLRRSTDGGRTWDHPRVIARTPPGAPPNPAPVARKVHQTGKTTNNPVAIADPQSGAVHFLYCVNYQRDRRRGTGGRDGPAEHAQRIAEEPPARQHQQGRSDRLVRPAL